MDNDDSIVGRIFTRRQALRATAQLGAGLAFTGLFSRFARAGTAPTTQPKLPLIAAPVMTEGPFFVDEKLNRSNLLGDTKRPSVINGLPLLLTFTVFKMTGEKVEPMKNTQVDVWHADSIGVYSDTDAPMNHEDTSKQTWLRGFQNTDETGSAHFTTIFPGWYPGRAPHVHFKVRQFNQAGQSTAEFTSQLFFHPADAEKVYSQKPYTGKHDTTNANDGIYNDRLSDGTPAGNVMLLDLAKLDDKGYRAIFPLVLSEGNLHSGRGRGFGPGGRGPGGPGGRPPRRPNGPPPR